MDLIEAIEKRISCRSFTTQGIEQEKVDALAAEVARINEEAGLHFQLYGPREDGTAIDMAANMFAGNPPYYVAYVGKTGPEPEELLGYYGEKLVLLATQLGLGTCWVATTYNAETTRVDLAEGEKLHEVLPIGYAPDKMPMKQRTIRAGIRARDKKYADLWQGPVPFDQAPEWIQACIVAVHKGPSAINCQPVVFVQDAEGAPVRATLPEIKRGLEYTDMGIAKLHFELAAAACGMPGKWEWGNGGAFMLD